MGDPLGRLVISAPFQVSAGILLSLSFANS
jgi:hypothetical protein